MNRTFTLQVLRGINLDWEKTKVPSKLREFCSCIPSVRLSQTFVFLAMKRL